MFPKDQEPQKQRDICVAVVRHASDIQTLREVLEHHGVTALDNDLAFAWLDYSEEQNVDWAPIPNNTRQVLSTLLRGIQAARHASDKAHNAVLEKARAALAERRGTESWTVSFQEASLEKGGGVLPLPAEMCVRMGLRAGSQVEIQRNDAGEMVLRKIGA